MAWQVPRRNQDHVKTHFEIGMFGMRHQPALPASTMRACWRGVTAKAASSRLARALTSTKAIRLRRLATISISPCGVRKRRARIDDSAAAGRSHPSSGHRHGLPAHASLFRPRADAGQRRADSAFRAARCVGWVRRGCVVAPAGRHDAAAALAGSRPAFVIDYGMNRRRRHSPLTRSPKSSPPISRASCSISPAGVLQTLRRWFFSIPRLHPQ